MKKIPVNVNGDVNNLVGFLEIDETAITDKQLLNMYVSWMWVPDRQKVIAVSLVPMLKVTIDNDASCFECDNGMHGICPDSHCKCRREHLYEHPELTKSDSLAKDHKGRYLD